MIMNSAMITPMPITSFHCISPRSKSFVCFTGNPSHGLLKCSCQTCEHEDSEMLCYMNAHMSRELMGQIESSNHRITSYQTLDLIAFLSKSAFVPCVDIGEETPRVFLVWEWPRVVQQCNFSCFNLSNTWRTQPTTSKAQWSAFSTNCPAFRVPHFHQVLPFQGVHQNRLTTSTTSMSICIWRWVTKIENEGMCGTLVGFPVTSAKICVWCQVSTLFIVQKAHLWHCFLTLEELTIRLPQHLRTTKRPMSWMDLNTKGVPSFRV